MEQACASRLTSLNDDVLLDICAALQETLVTEMSQTTLYINMFPYNAALKALSLTCKRIRVLCVPLLFDTIAIQIAWKQDTWARALARLESWDLAMAQYVRTVIITLLPGPTKESPLFPNSLPAKLADLLQSTTRLDTLTVLIAPDHASLFAAEFARRRLVFPSVRRLALGPSNEVFLPYFPDARTLTGRHTEWAASTKETSHALVRAAARLERLECLVLREQWDPSLMDVVQDAIPGLKILVMAPPSTLHQDLSLETLVAHLSRFPALTILSLPPAAVLLAGFTHPSGAEVGLHSVKRRRAEAEEHVARTVFEQCAQMREVWFGGMRRAMLGPDLLTKGGERELVWDSKVPVWLQR
ncbi:hypothetical protein BDW22DRAFT_1341019 [Trametopsis cervina]|nr:hypothetical protein BDW22DRAFT_1341019 [Trametopsis cervina]